VIKAEDQALRHALDDFALASGYLIVVSVDADGRVLDFNKGFEASVRPAGDPRGRPLSDFVATHSGVALEVVPGLPDAAPIPYPLRTWGGHDLLLHAYPLPPGGALLIGSAISPDDAQGIQRMARLTTEMGNLVRELRRANQRIQEIANHDGLTGLANRRYFFERLEPAIKHAQRHARPLSVLMADLDRFKQVNDRFGHAGGDKVLCAFATLLNEGARAADLPARLGGEEFAVMLPDTDQRQAWQMAERLRAAMAALRPLGPEHRFTVSIGLGMLQAEDDADAIVASADDALYKAKEAGRDRVEVGRLIDLPFDRLTGRPSSDILG
jgi:diguanylate cyclase (GGDEF)-like protein